MKSPQKMHGHQVSLKNTNSHQLTIIIVPSCINPAQTWQLAAGCLILQ
jgi:hypothetical protein